MGTPPLYIPVSVNRLQIVSTRISFFIGGLILPSWAPLVPLTKARAGLDNGGLGLLLLGLGIGSLLAMPFAGYLTARFGCRAVIVFSIFVLCIAFPILNSLSWLPGLALIMVIFGASMGMLDCAINIQSLILQKNNGVPLQSGFQGFFSLGSIFGSVLMTALLSFGLEPIVTVLCVVTVILGALYKAVPALLPYGNEREGPTVALPRGIVLLLGILCFIVFLTEGAMLDWSAVFLVSSRGMEPRMGGLGYAFFAVMMTLGRLLGDRIVRRFGGIPVLVVGGIIAAIGMIISLGFPGWPASLIGFGLMGAGCSNISPLIFAAVGRQKRMPQRVAVPAVLSMGYAGILIGPALIGMVAHLSTLSAALGCLIFLLLFVSATARFVRV
ncbi:MFS transporter [Pseudomonas fluorescens]|uniref:MFS transporter n=1 Tax=Pseudomonas fluorescens TaxID=294 RepID=A0A327NEB9_PSEFL|nr:MFS transporter [Pseudomonas fluorescens]RAI72476.1 MFS transporter [Pseudomonas fluorescens]